MHLYQRLKDNNMIDNEKEFSELIHLRQIKINNKRIIDPSLKLKKHKKYEATVGILTKII